MPTPIALCIEDLEATSDGTRFLRCVALANPNALGIGPHGDMTWQDDQPQACQVAVSADQRLVLLRKDLATPVTLRRDTRSLEVPVGKPVFVLAGDLIELAGRTLRVHVHGESPVVAPPSFLPPRRSPLRGWAKAAAAAMAIGASAGAMSAGCDRIIAVREEPPVVPVSIPDTTVTAPDAGPAQGDVPQVDKDKVEPKIEQEEPKKPDEEPKSNPQ